jgi:hypothetical protein
MEGKFRHNLERKNYLGSVGVDGRMAVEMI